MRFSYPKVRGSKPLISTKEMADKFGVSLGCVSSYLGRSGAPKPIFKHHSVSGGMNKWYNKEEVFTWWKKIKG